MKILLILNIKESEWFKISLPYLSLRLDRFELRVWGLPHGQKKSENQEKSGITMKNDKN